MKRLWAFLTIMLLPMCTPVHAQGMQTNFYGKPVMCGSPEEQIAMWQQLKDDNFMPLIGFRGNSFLQDGQKFEVDYFVMYDPEGEKIAIMERQASGFQCVIAGGTGNVTFDPDEMRDIIGWEILD